MQSSTNPNHQYHAPGSKEDIELNKSAVTNFKPEKQFALKSENIFEYTAALKDCSIEFGQYGILSWLETSTIITPVDKGEDKDPTDVSLCNYKNQLTSWNKIETAAIQKNATMTWGDKTWTKTDKKEIIPFSAACGELINARLNEKGKTLYTKQKKLSWIGYHALSLLLPQD